MDKVLIKNMTFNGCHGCDDYEKYKPQPFAIDIELNLNLSDSMVNDSIESTINYSEVYKLVEEVVEKESYDLIEKLASVIIDKIKKHFMVDGIKVLVKKPNAPISGKFDYVAVEIERSFSE